MSEFKDKSTLLDEGGVIGSETLEYENANQHRDHGRQFNGIVETSSQMLLTNLVVHARSPEERNKNPLITSPDDGYRRLMPDLPSAEDVTDQTYTEFSEAYPLLCWVCHHKVIRHNWKIFLGSLALTILGLLLVITGIVFGSISGFVSDVRAIVFIVGGLLCLIPGGYHFIFMCLAAYEVKGFKFNKLPTVRLPAV